MTKDDPGEPICVALAALAALAVSQGIGRFAFTPILPMMQQDSGLSVSEGGWLASANYVGYLAGALWAVRLKLPARTAIRIGLAVTGASTLAMALHDGFVLWVVLRALAGIASAWVLVFVSAWALERLTSLRRLSLGGVVYAGVGTGVVVAGLGCLALMNLHASSFVAWTALGIVALVSTAVIWPVFGSGGTPVSPPARESAPHDARYWRMVICYGAYGFGYIIPATFLPVMAKQIVSDPLLFGWAWPVFGLAAVCSTLIAQRVRRSQRAVWAACHLVMAVGVVVPLVVPGLAGIIVAALCVGGTFVVITQVGLQEGRAVAGSHARALIAAMTSAFALGQIFGPLLAGYWVKATGGFAGALVIAAALLVASAVALLRR